MIAAIFKVFFRVAGISAVAALLWNCSGNEVFIANPKATVSIVSSPAAAEGVPGLEYVFTPKTDNAPVQPRFEWLLDDSVVLVTPSKQGITLKFPRDGWYFVRVNLYNAADGRLAASDLYKANIRSSFPQIAMMTVPAGQFTMGSDRNYYEQPVRSITISQRLAVGTYEVLQSEWRALMGYSPSWFKGDSLPVETVSWFDAIDYCNRLSVRAGFAPCYTTSGDTVRCNFTANGYRLPTEAEWEYIARAGATTDSYTGNFRPATDGCFPPDPALDPLGWYCANAGGSTRRAGMKQPNAFGLYDVCGNVSEWCWDFYDGVYYQTSTRFDPRGPETGFRRIARGGAFINDIFTMRLSYRDSQYPSRPSFNLGFRVVRTLE